MNRILTRVGFLKESNDSDGRVIITPEAVSTYVESSYDVLVEEGLGNLVGFSDSDYRVAGANIQSKNEIYQKCSTFVKLKSPTVTELEEMPIGSILGGYLHLESNKELIDAMIRRSVTTYAFEFFSSDGNVYPMSRVNSEIAGKTAVIYGAYHLQTHLEGSGRTPFDSSFGTNKTHVLVIGYGNMGLPAIKLSASMGMKVTVLGRDELKLSELKKSLYEYNIRVFTYSDKILASLLPNVDIVIGAIQISTYDTKPMITHEHLKTMKQGSLIVDATCGYGSGYLPTFYSETSLDVPYYVVDGIKHIKISRLPAAYAKTASELNSINVTDNIISWLESLKNGCINSTSSRGLLIDRGVIVNDLVKDNYESFL
jgi:alanine dehydrogenase